MSDILPFPLYHGTSTVFLEDIKSLGLGAKDPLAEIGIHEFIADLLPVIDANLGGTAIYEARRQSFGMMAEQKRAAMNFQHGQTYLSPCKQTAIRYAVNKHYGSELLSYCMVFLKMLLDREVSGVADVLYQRHPAMFRYVDISASPVLVRADEVPASALRTEHGEDASELVKRLLDLRAKKGESFEKWAQQGNFRLVSPLLPTQSAAWLVNVLEWDSFAPKYKLYELRG